MIRITTETGSRYTFDDALTVVRRTPAPEPGHELRRDAEWLQLHEAPTLREGHHAVLALEPLGEGNVTFRTTSPVLTIERDIQP